MPFLVVAQKPIDVEKEKVIATMIACVWMDSDVEIAIVLQVSHGTMAVATNPR